GPGRKGAVITPVIVPDVGATGGDVRVAAWLAREGDRVTAGAPLFVLETDKATQEVEAFRAGYLRKILAPADARVEVGAPVALLGDTPDDPLDAPTAQPAPSPGGQETALPPSPALPSGRALAGPRTGRVLASPLAKRLAREHGIDLATIPGSGP